MVLTWNPFQFPLSLRDSLFHGIAYISFVLYQGLFCIYAVAGFPIWIISLVASSLLKVGHEVPSATSMSANVTRLEGLNITFLEFQFDLCSKNLVLTTSRIYRAI